MPDLLAHPFSLHGLVWGMLVYLAIIAWNTLLNRWMLPRLDDGGREVREWPPVAVLIPARNEEKNIRRCVTSVLAQDYPDFAVWVLDDDSTDGTWAILTELARQDERLHIRRGLPLPEGWLGKNWACHQLASGVPERYTHFLFVDADTWHAPDMLRGSVATLMAHQVDLLSALPQQETHTPGEMLSVPILPWALLSHYPLWLLRKVRWSWMAAAVGQHMLWRREAYEKIGGHAFVRRESAEDLALARRAVAHGFRALVASGRGKVFCRMYRTWKDVVAGFGRTLFNAFGGRVVLYVFVWFWVAYAFTGPWAAAIWAWTVGDPALRTSATLAVILTLGIWGMVVFTNGMGPVIVLLSPLVVLNGMGLAMLSLVITLARQRRWKGRRL